MVLAQIKKESITENSENKYSFDPTILKALIGRGRISNCMERLNKEIKKRTKIVGVFPNPESCERLIGSLLMKQHNEWMEDKAYLTEKELEKSAFCE